MEYKTPFIAKKLGISPKAVVRIAQQLNLHLGKNKYGHYVFTETDLQKMLELQLTTIEQEEKSTVPVTQTSSTDELKQFARQLESITLRLDRIEEKMQEKADNVVTYQLLQHRREMEEMLEKIERLESALKRKEPIYIAPDNQPQKQTEKPKRRKMILSIFGF
ncbi:chromosome segregation protein [Bacillus manliponensis]|uniref:Chromosome-anchoring protein RacA n=1 Tax=Bacillus manliponensis TaxID=574376 RepID=A0A073JTE8_9BACI|nr:chromosome segregation protein [Bacillus manliponensis]KEK18359.1 chromosome segregation protein [Bacillus manliponensis]